MSIREFLHTLGLSRGTRVITCPDNHRPAAVKVALVGLHLRTCTRWPEKAGCGQECLAQIEAAPHDCLVRNIVARWYEGKRCVECNRPIGAIVWHERPPAVRFTGNVTREWKEIAAEDLPEAFAKGEPVCWPCHIFDTFRREHPDMVVERVRPALAAPSILAPTSSVY